MVTKVPDKFPFTVPLQRQESNIAPAEMEKIRNLGRSIEQYEISAPTHINPINNSAISQIPLNAEKRKATPQLPTEMPDLPDLPPPTDNYRDDIRPLDTPLNRLKPKPHTFNV